MSQDLPPQSIFNDTSKGVITNVAPRLAPQNSVAHAVNFVFDEHYGEAETREGYAIIGAQLVAEDNTINGLYQFIDSEGGANSRLLAAVNAVGDATQNIYYYDGANWVSTLTGDTAGLKTRLETFLDRVIRVNGTDAVRCWNGSDASWETSGGRLDLGSFPRGSLVSVYKDQVITAGVSGNPDALRVSSVPSSNTISWSTGDRTIVVNPEDNSNITALGEIGSLLIVFKRFAMYRWNNRSTEADVVVDVGCSSQESVAVGGGMMFFFNENGIWATRGDYPTRISRPVQRWIDGMSASFYTNVSGHCDGKYYLCSIGDVTLDSGDAYNNVVLRYSIDTHEWAVFSHANEFRVFSQYVTSGAVEIVGGDTTARVFQLNSGTTDNGSNINFEIESHEMEFGSRGIIKEISDRCMGYGVNPVDALVQVRIDRGDWITLGTLDNDVNEMSLSQVLIGHYFVFRVSGSHATARFRLQGLEFPSVSLLDYQS